MSEWFNVDKNGLAQQLARRPKSFAVFELIQNAWDSGTSDVVVSLTPVEGKPQAILIVEDFSNEGFIDLDHAYTMFARSSRASDPTKRGRFNLGEKMVLSLCASAEIASTTGSLIFSESGRRRSKARRDRGTKFTGWISMTRDELAQVEQDVARLIAPVPTTFNGRTLDQPKLLKTLQAKLPTELADADGAIRRSTRVATIELYSADDATGEILELGIPVVEAEIGYRVNVLQKIPLNLDRDNVTPTFLKALRVAVVNAMAEQLPEDVASEPWVMDAIADSRINRDAFAEIQKKRFGDRAVVATPGDPVANAQAEANGFTVIHGGAMSAGAWANARKFESLPAASAVFPTPKPQELAGRKLCPACNRPM